MSRLFRKGPAFAGQINERGDASATYRIQLIGSRARALLNIKREKYGKIAIVKGKSSVVRLKLVHILWAVSFNPAS